MMSCVNVSYLNPYLDGLINYTGDNDPVWCGAGDELFDYDVGVVEQDMYFLGIMFYSGWLEVWSGSKKDGEYDGLSVFEVLWELNYQLFTHCYSWNFDYSFMCNDYYVKDVILADWVKDFPLVDGRRYRYVDVVDSDGRVRSTPAGGDSWLVGYLRGNGYFDQYYRCLVPLVPFWFSDCCLLSVDVCDSGACFVVSGVYGPCGVVEFGFDGFRQVDVDVDVEFGVVSRNGLFRVVDGSIFCLDPVFGVDDDAGGKYLLKVGGSVYCFYASCWSIRPRMSAGCL